MRSRPELRRFKTFSAYIDEAKKYMDQQDERIKKLEDVIKNIILCILICLL